MNFLFCVWGKVFFHPFSFTGFKSGKAISLVACNVHEGSHLPHIQEVILCSCIKSPCVCAGSCFVTVWKLCEFTYREKQPIKSQKYTESQFYLLWVLMTPQLNDIWDSTFSYCLNTLSWGHLLLIGNTILTDTYSYDQVLSLHVVYNFIGTK